MQRRLQHSKCQKAVFKFDCCIGVFYLLATKSVYLKVANPCNNFNCTVAMKYVIVGEIMVIM